MTRFSHALHGPELAETPEDGRTNRPVVFLSCLAGSQDVLGREQSWGERGASRAGLVCNSERASAGQESRRWGRSVRTAGPLLSYEE